MAIVRSSTFTCLGVLTLSAAFACSSDDTERQASPALVPAAGSDAAPPTSSGMAGTNGGADASTSSGSPASTGPGDWGPGDYPPDLSAQSYLEIADVDGQNGLVRQETLDGLCAGSG